MSANRACIVCHACDEQCLLGTTEGPAAIYCSCRELLLEIPLGVTAFGALTDGTFAWFLVGDPSGSYGALVDGGGGGKIRVGRCEMFIVPAAKGERTQ